MALPFTVREFNSSDDFYICTPEALEFTTIDDTTEKEQKPIVKNWELLMRDTHVYLPFYNRTRWELIQAALTKISDAEPTTFTFNDFKECLEMYIDHQVDFSALEALIDSGWMNGTVLSELLPQIARLALDLPKQIGWPIRLLRSRQDGSLTLTKRQAASLLANAFFSTYSNRDRTRFSRINFARLFQRRTPHAIEKLKCLLHYFSRICSDPPTGILRIVRQRAPVPDPDWAEMNIPLAGMQHTDDVGSSSPQLVAMPAGRIEDDGAEMTQLDFANEYIGGGVLGYGLVQEEIRFLICPELIVSCLVCELMEPDEAILMIGAERYSNYDGYDRTFRWKFRRKCEPEGPTDPAAINHGEVLAIDALNYAGQDVQFQERYIRRELLKTYAGFSLRTPWSPMGIASGNWGCGAFGGDVQLKSIIQLIAAAAVGRPLFYFTFGRQIFAEQLDTLYKLMVNKEITIGMLYRLIVEYGQSDQILRRPNGIFKWIRQKIQGESEDMNGTTQN